MIKEILSPETCGECRLCCFFDGYGSWDTPTFTQEQMEAVKQLAPMAEEVRFGRCFRFRINSMSPDIRGMYPCPALNPEEGCMLGDDKPFECAIWPYRVINDDGIRAIGIGQMCDAMMEKPMSELRDFLLKDGLAERIFEYADRYPDMVKESNEFYPILIKKG